MDATEKTETFHSEASDSYLQIFKVEEMIGFVVCHPGR